MAIDMDPDELFTQYCQFVTTHKWTLRAEDAAVEVKLPVRRRCVKHLFSTSTDSSPPKLLGQAEQKNLSLELPALKNDFAPVSATPTESHEIVEEGRLAYQNNQIVESPIDVEHSLKRVRLFDDVLPESSKETSSYIRRSPSTSNQKKANPNAFVQSLEEPNVSPMTHVGSNNNETTPNKARGVSKGSWSARPSLASHFERPRLSTPRRQRPRQSPAKGTILFAEADAVSRSTWDAIRDKVFFSAGRGTSAASKPSSSSAPTPPSPCHTLPWKKLESGRPNNSNETTPRKIPKRTFRPLGLRGTGKSVYSPLPLVRRRSEELPRKACVRTDSLSEKDQTLPTTPSPPGSPQAWHSRPLHGSSCKRKQTISMPSS